VNTEQSSLTSHSELLLTFCDRGPSLPCRLPAGESQTLFTQTHSYCSYNNHVGHLGRHLVTAVCCPADNNNLSLVHVVANAWDGDPLVASETVCLCPCSKRKTTWAINTKRGTHILHDCTSACVDPKIKRSKVKVSELWSVVLYTRQLTDEYAEISSFSIKYAFALQINSQTSDVADIWFWSDSYPATFLQDTWWQTFVQQ